MASFDGNGLQIDRLADIRVSIEDSLKDSFGDGIDLSEDSPFGVLIGIMSERYSLLYELVEAIYLASFPNTAFGTYLDQACAFNGVIREEATASTVILQFTRSNDINGGDVTIPAGTQVIASGGSTVIWQTDVEATILDTTMTITVAATAQTVGAISAPAGTLDTLVAAVARVDSVTNPGDATLGQDRETDAALRRRRQVELGRTGTATEAGIRSGLVLMDEVRAAALNINDTDVAVGDLPPHSFEAAIVPATGFNLGMDATLTFSGDLVTGNSIAITIDAVPIAGSPIAFLTDNATTMGLIAAALEAEDLVYRAESDGGNVITIQGATRDDFVVAAVVTGGASQPTAAFVEINSAGTTLDDIAQQIWDTKAAGIQTYGALQGRATDSVGDFQMVYFSQVEEVRVWIRYTLTVDATYDSSVAEPAIQTAVAEWAIANLTAGVDVLMYKVLCVASDVNALGVLDISVERSLDNVSWFSTNIPIAINELATIDSADVSFV